jgi:hypothetical protein
MGGWGGDGEKERERGGSRDVGEERTEEGEKIMRNDGDACVERGGMEEEISLPGYFVSSREGDSSLYFD